MTDILNTFDRLRRPRLLIRAARTGAAGYRREAHLPRLLGYGALPRGVEALTRLMSLESDLDENRRGGRSSYTVAGHVDVLIAMMGEARILRASRPDLVLCPLRDAARDGAQNAPESGAGPQEKASGIESFRRAT